MPAEWQEHEAVWLAWPSHGDLWQDELAAAQRAVAELCRAIADVDPATGQARGERIELLVLDDAGEADARRALAGIPARCHHIPFGDIWLRDTGPIFVHAASGVHAACFGFNGWGRKYLFPPDLEVSRRIANHAGAPAVAHDWILEGGAIDTDGDGTAITTRECLLNPNRNPGMTEGDIERRLQAALGFDRVLWLERGLANDHTDGHVDNLARFVAPGVVVCMRPADASDPNRAVLDQIRRDLAGFRTRSGSLLEVVDIPSPGSVTLRNGELAPASYVNFYLGNRAVVVPTFGVPGDREAVDTIGRLFPGRTAVGIDACGILSGGGAFHCISREQPMPEEQS